jgi:carboxymethylenebutenolidase
MRIEPGGHLAAPPGGKSPGVLVLHAWWGLNGFFRDLCERLAREGFAAYAPDLYHGNTAATIEEAERLRSKLDRKQAPLEIAAASAYLMGLECVQGQTHAVIGFSLGAYYALGLSVERPEAVRAVVAFYGARRQDYAAAQASYLGHFAEHDPYVSASGLKDLEKSLRKAGRPATLYTYAGTGHWFFESDRPEAYCAEAAELAWRRTLEFLRSALIQTGPRMNSRLSGETC